MVSIRGARAKARSQARKDIKEAKRRGESVNRAAAMKAANKSVKKIHAGSSGNKQAGSKSSSHKDLRKARQEAVRIGDVRTASDIRRIEKASKYGQTGKIQTILDRINQRQFSRTGGMSRNPQPVNAFTRPTVQLGQRNIVKTTTPDMSHITTIPKPQVPILDRVKGMIGGATSSLKGTMQAEQAKPFRQRIMEGVARTITGPVGTVAGKLMPDTPVAKFQQAMGQVGLQKSLSPLKQDFGLKGTLLKATGTTPIYLSEEQKRRQRENAQQVVDRKLSFEDMINRSKEILTPEQQKIAEENQSAKMGFVLGAVNPLEKAGGVKIPKKSPLIEEAGKVAKQQGDDLLLKLESKRSEINNLVMKGTANVDDVAKVDTIIGKLAKNKKLTGDEQAHAFEMLKKTTVISPRKLSKGGQEAIDWTKNVDAKLEKFMKATPEQPVSGIPTKGTSKTTRTLASSQEGSQLPPVKSSLVKDIADDGDPVKKIVEALKIAKPIRGKQEALYSKARAQRVARIAAMGEKVPGEKGYFAQLGQLKGELPKAQFESIRKSIKQVDIDSLFNRVESAVITPFEKINAKTGLSKLLAAEGGQVPTKSELKLLNEIFPPEFMQAVLEKRPFMQKLWEQAGNILNLPRAMMATADLSAPLRQGIFLIGKPSKWLPAAKDMFKYAFSEKAYQGLMKDIKVRPTYKAMRQSKLALTDMGTDLAAREEAFMSNLAEKIPVFGSLARGSNRAYTGFLNKLRADTFDDLFAKSKDLIPDNPKIADDIAKFVNAATGRGDLGALNKASVVLNGAFFSPRLMASRLNLLNPKFYLDLEPAVRKEALKSLLTFAGAGATILGLAKLGGVEVGVDPRSADFGKMKVGDTRYDMWGGFQQYIVLASRLISGEMVSSTTGREFTLGEGYKATTRLDIIQRFFESKTSPVASFALGLLKGKTTQGEDLNLPADLADRFLPMVAQDMFELYREKGWEGLGMALPAIFGVGVQTYGNQIPMESKTKSGAPSIKWRQEPGLGETLINKMTGKQVSTIPEDKQEQLRQEREADFKKQAEIDKAKQLLLQTGKTQIVGDTKIYLEDGIVKTTKSETLLDAKEKYKEFKDLPDEEFKKKIKEMKSIGDKESNIAEQMMVYKRNDTARSLGLEFEKEKDWSQLNQGDKGNVLEEHIKWLGDKEKVDFFKTMLDKDFLTDPQIKEIAKRGVLKPDDILKADVSSGVKSMVLYETLKAETGDFFKDAEDRQGALDELNEKTEQRLKDAITKLDMSPREKQSQFDSIVQGLKDYKLDDRAREFGLSKEDERWSQMNVNDRAGVLVKHFTGMDKPQAEEKFADMEEKGLITESVKDEFVYQWKKAKVQQIEELPSVEEMRDKPLSEMTDEELQTYRGRLASATQSAEATLASSDDPTTLASINIGQGTLAQRNNNPGNLRYAGQEGASQGEGGFARFDTPEAGYEALKRQIEIDKGRGMTVSEFVSKYAPPTENDTETYIKQFNNYVDSSPETKLSSLDTGKVAEFMALKESSTTFGEKLAQNPPVLNQSQTTLLRQVATGKVSEEQATQKILNEISDASPEVKKAAEQIAMVPPKVKYSNIGYIPPEHFDATSRIYGLIASLQLLQSRWTGTAPTQII